MARPYKRLTPIPRPEYRAHHARICLGLLLTARQHARDAGLGFTLPRIDRAIASARGAVRNAEGRVGRP